MNENSSNDEFTIQVYNRINKSIIDNELLDITTKIRLLNDVKKYIDDIIKDIHQAQIKELLELGTD